MGTVVLSVRAGNCFCMLRTFSSIVITPGAGADPCRCLCSISVILAVINLLYDALDRLWQQERDIRMVLEREPVGLIGVGGGGN